MVATPYLATAICHVRFYYLMEHKMHFTRHCRHHRFTPPLPYAPPRPWVSPGACGCWAYKINNLYMKMCVKSCLSLDWDWDWARVGSLFAKLLKRMRVRLFAKVISRTCGGGMGMVRRNGVEICSFQVCRFHIFAFPRNLLNKTRLAYCIKYKQNLLPLFRCFSLSFPLLLCCFFAIYKLQGGSRQTILDSPFLSRSQWTLHSALSTVAFHLLRLWYMSE